MSYYKIHYTDFTRPLKSLTQCLNAVLTLFKITEDSIKTKSRLQDLVDARYLFFKLASENTVNPLVEIGAKVKRSHATVLHGLSKVEDDSLLKKQYSQAKAILHNTAKYGSTE